MICRPMGRPLRLKPHGIDIAGKPSAFMPRVNRVAAARTSSATPLISSDRLPDLRRGHRRSGSEDAVHLLEQPGELTADAAARALRFDIVDGGNSFALIEHRQHVCAEVRTAIEKRPQRRGGFHQQTRYGGGAQRFHVRDLNFDHASTGAGGGIERRTNRRLHFGIYALHEKVLGEANAESGQIRICRWDVIGGIVNHRLERDRRIADCARERPYMILRKTERQHAADVDSAKGRLQTHHAAERRGHTNRPAGIGPCGEWQNPRRDGRSRSAARPAGNALRSHGLWIAPKCGLLEVIP